MLDIAFDELLILIFILLIYVLFCYWIGKYAKDTVINFWGGFLLALLLSPFVGIIVVVVLKITKESKNDI